MKYVLTTLKGLGVFVATIVLLPILILPLLFYSLGASWEDDDADI